MCRASFSFCNARASASIAFHLDFFFSFRDQTSLLFAVMCEKIASVFLERKIRNFLPFVPQQNSIAFCLLLLLLLLIIITIIVIITLNVLLIMETRGTKSFERKSDGEASARATDAP